MKLKKVESSSKDKKILWALLTFLGVAPLQAAGRGTEGFGFLKLPVSARAVGMGECSAAASEGGESLYHNPAGLSAATQWGIHSFNMISSDFYRMNHLALAAPMKKSVFGLGVMALTQDSMERFDNAGSRAGNFEAYDTGFLAAFSHSAGALRLGGTVKWMRSQIDDTKAEGWALDLGMQRRFQHGFTLGAAVLNLGPSVRFSQTNEPLPTQISAGISYPLSRLLVTGEVSRRIHADENRFSLGAEYRVVSSQDSQVNLRSGYSPGLSNPGASNIFTPGFRAGMGIAMKSLTLDYAVAPFADSGFAHRISVGFSFGKRRS